MLSELPIWEMIREIYPVAFIGLVVMFSGYIKGWVSGRAMFSAKQKRLEILEKRLSEKV